MAKAEIKRLGILGGTFDPPHIGHLLLAQSALEKLRLDRILFVPAAVQPHKRRRKISSPQTRLNLLKLALAGDDRFTISDVELKRPGPSYTVDTIRALQELYPAVKLYFIIGGDNISDIATWKDPESIFAIARVAAALRPDSRMEGSYKDKVRLFHMPLIEISSSQIRKLVSQGRSIKYLVPDEVEKYILRSGMYL